MVPPNHPWINRVFHDFHHPFWDTPIFGNTHIDLQKKNDSAYTKPHEAKLDLTQAVDTKPRVKNKFFTHQE